MQPRHVHLHGRPRCARASRRGATLIELLVSIVAAGILVTTVGLMLYFVSRESTRTGAGVNMQADSRVTMQTLAHLIRGAIPGSVSVNTNGVLFVTDSANVIHSIYGNASNLVHDPDLSVSGNEIVLIDGALSNNGFQVSVVGNLVQITLLLTAGDNTYQETLKGAFTWRN